MSPSFAGTLLAPAAFVLLGPSLFGSSGKPEQVTLDARPLERHLCGDAATTASNDIVAALRVKADAGRVLHITVTSDGTFQPAVMMSADAGDAAEMGWSHEIGGAGFVVETTVVLPARGLYTFSVNDRRTGLPQGPHPSCVDLRIATAHLPQVLPMPPSWYGTVDNPVTFDISRVDPESQVISVENLAMTGILMASVFENGAYRDMALIPPHESRQFAINAYAVSPRLIVEQGVSPRGEGIAAFVTCAPYELAPDFELARVGAAHSSP